MGPRRRRSEVRQARARHRPLPAGRRRSGEGDPRVQGSPSLPPHQGCRAEQPVPGATGRSGANVPVRRARAWKGGSARCVQGARGHPVQGAGRSWSSIACPDDARTPKESAEICKKYLEGRGFTLRSQYAGTFRPHCSCRLGCMRDPAPSVAQDGWVPLFDGKTLTGWRGYKKRGRVVHAMEDRRRDADARCRRRQGHARRARRNHASRPTTFSNWRWEWKIAPGGNSGVKYFVLEDRDAAIGHEYQMHGR